MNTTAENLTAARLLIALDIDGTLVPDGTTDVPDVTRQAVADVVAAGHVVVLATGRSLVGAVPVAEALGLNGSYVVASNGAVTARLDRTWPCGYRVESCQTLDVAPVLHLARRLCPAVRVAVEEVGWGYHVSELFDPGEVNGRQIVVPDDDLTAEPAPRVILSAPNATAVLLEPVRSLGVTVNPASPSWLDVTPVGLSKASALDAIRQRLAVAPEHTVFVGDGINDLEAMAWAARSFAMGHAPMLVQDTADHVTGTLAEHGAATVLRNLLAEQTRPGAGAQAMAGAGS
ncbi:Cof-type HAD-IIB family hydrolase [Antribacter sp. KLBMP9083]|uniref:Cof-type HAD-IIB family hydrolase n=1 Tax=Antribacter soli TaxID=2910976 RepID=A0AA41QBA6_9MICO|nr:HAD family hydrolase [Antribacter soli]MCF4119966.1 Cof-type HAD-IIB family hydrolase [Antribacter soli]